MEDGGDAHVVAERLGGMEFRGRARLCRDVAARCLGEAGPLVQHSPPWCFVEGHL